MIDLSPTVSPTVTWYKQHKKSYPWRTQKSAYTVWVSEIMLQQTRIEAAIPYYHRFLSALPTVQDLADADEDTLLKLWQGLGYYSRVRNLGKAAKTICETYDGVLPDTVQELTKLAGIGEYTAGAIASIAYGKPEPAVDGNVLRLVMRLADCKDDVMLPKTRKWVTQALKAVYPTGEDAGCFTEGLMELGETVCLPNTVPLCESCPLQSLCQGYQHGTARDLPVRSAPKKQKVQHRTVIFVGANDKIALVKREGGLLQGLYEPLNLEDTLDSAAVKTYLETKGATVESVTALGNATHLFSHIKWQMTGYYVRCTTPFLPPPFVWVTSNELETAYAVPTAFKPLLEKAHIFD